MPEQYEWGLWRGNESYSLPHSYVYRKDVGLLAGTTYHFQTRNVRSGWFGRPDPVMYLVRGNDIVGFNDDYTGLASEIIFTPTVADTYRLVIRAFTTATPGYCDLYQGVGGAAPSLLESDVMFGGTYIWVRWKLGEWFETGRSVIVFLSEWDARGSVPADPYLFLIYPDSAVGSQMYWDDDSAGSLNSKIVPPSGGTGTIILGSYSRYSGGECALGLVGQSYKAPWMSPAPWASVAEPVVLTPTVTKYIKELERRKPTLEKLSPDERDEQVLDLQRTLLSEEEIRQQRSPVPAVSTELVHRQDDFLEHYSQMERDLVEMSYHERAATLAQMKRETLGREYSEPEKPPLREGEEENR